MITIEKSPQKLQPVYNEIVFVSSSDNTTKLGFNFVSEVIVGGNTIARIKYPANPDGYAVLDLHKHLQTQVTHDFDNETSVDYADKSSVIYDVTFAEEFRPLWEFESNTASGSPQVGFRSVNDPSLLFDIGDTVVIDQDAGYTYGAYNGIATITNIAFNATAVKWEVFINKPLGAGTTFDAGIMTLANLDSKVFPVEHTITDNVAFNGVLPYKSFIGYNDDIYTNDAIGDTPVGQFLTTLPTVGNTDTNAPYTLAYKTRRHSKLWLNSYTRDILDIVIEVDGTQYVMHSSTVVDPNEPIMQYGVGVDQINNSTDIYTYVLDTPGVYVLTPAVQPIIDDTVTSYKVYGYESNPSDGVTRGLYKEGYIFNIEDACTIYEDIQLVFMDKLGSFVPFHFDLVSRNVLDIQKTNYQTDYGKYSNISNNWTYRSFDRGTSSLDTVVTERYTLTSNWVSQEVSNWLMELYTSPEVYWINEDGDAIAVNLTVSTIERKKTVNDQLINYTVTFNLSNRDNQQLG